MPTTDLSQILVELGTQASRLRHFFPTPLEGTMSDYQSKVRHDPMAKPLYEGNINNAALKQPSPLEQAGRQLTRVMESCEAQLCLLSARLAPVLDPRERPAAVGSDPGPAIPPLHGAGQLAANLHEATMRIQAIELRIQDLLDRLEL